MSHDNAGSRLDSATVVSLAATALGIFVVAVLPEDKASLAGGLVIGVAGLGNATGPTCSAGAGCSL
jgi:hypothetical protein